MPAGRLVELLETDTSPQASPRGDAGVQRVSRPAPAVAGRGNLVRQAISLLVHHPAAGARIPVAEALEGLDRPGVPLLLELLAQLREDPVSTTGALLERWRGRPEHAPLSRLAAGECLVSDAEAAAAEIRSSLERLVADHTLDRLQALEEKSRTEPLTAEEKTELQGLLRSRVQSARAPAAKP
jgi:DNA primase